MRKQSFLISLLVLASLLLAACGGAPATEAPAPAATEAPAAAAATDTPVPDEPEEMGERVQIRWYVGLGAGSDEPTFDAQKQVVAEYNASQDKIELVIEIVDANVAYDTLATQIAGGNAPDIVGPVGIKGRDSFRGAWLDLQPLVDKNNYDLSDFDPAMVEFYKVGDELLGLPFAVFPSFVLVNLDLFDEAGLDYPPQEYGAAYADGDEWTIDKLEELAVLLTVDTNGNDATSPDFDPENIVQFGYGEQWTDPRGVGTLFGAGSLVDADGNAQIPENWREAWHWVYDGMWEKYFYPNKLYGDSDILANTNWFESGNIGMVHTHLWYVACCMGGLEAAWDTAAVPAYQGTITAKMHADTFEIHENTDHPDEAFEVLTYLLGPASETLTKIYGGMPARLSQQGTYFDSFAEEKFPGQDINWQVVADSIAYADNPNHESYMPSFQEATDQYNEFWNTIIAAPVDDLDAEIENLQIELQRIFDAADE
jgi:multiple sugar transport system substrate-binding protein